jgi:hypothetical protein
MDEMVAISFIVALVVLFFHTCTQPGMVFEFVSKALDKVHPYLKKPLYDCPICATVWWGPSIIACGILGKIWLVTNVFQLAIILCVAAGLNTVFVYVINSSKAIAKTLNEYECNCTRKEDKALERKERLAKLNK